MDFLSLMKKIGIVKKELKNGRQFENKIMASLFFEPSTRTQQSFATAFLSLGGKIVGFNSTKDTSLEKGETFHDTIKMYEAYSDVIVLRHKLEGAPKYASEISKTPVINAGDGTNEHPTQTLLDLFTIYEEFGAIDGLNVGFLGDLKYGRTVHSLAKSLTCFNSKMFFISPETLKMSGEVRKYITEKKADFEEHTNLNEVLGKLDVLYVTRIQRERLPDDLEYEKVKDCYRLNTLNIIPNSKKSLRILHPLPRVNEISTDLDDTPYALYFKQAENGIHARKALLLSILNGELQ